ncbi:MAG: response regulator [Victivallaceae bacterium]|jgi:CheY-like chemotaxis protein
MSNQKTNSNVLICDDDEILLSFYKRVIKNAGYDVLTASNGDEAVEILNEMPVALAIIDLLMPIRSGWEVIEYMKHKENLKNTPIIAVTGLSPSPGDLEKVNVQCSAIIHKGGDFDIEAFTALLKKLIVKDI